MFMQSYDMYYTYNYDGVTISQSTPFYPGPVVTIALQLSANYLPNTYLGS